MENVKQPISKKPVAPKTQLKQAIDSKKVSPKTPKKLQTPSVVSKVDDALPTAWKMDETVTQTAKSLEPSDLTESIKKAKAEGKTFEEFADNLYKKRYLWWTATPSKEFEKTAKAQLRTERDKLYQPTKRK